MYNVAFPLVSLINILLSEHATAAFDGWVIFLVASGCS